LPGIRSLARNWRAFRVISKTAADAIVPFGNVKFQSAPLTVINTGGMPATRRNTMLNKSKSWITTLAAIACLGVLTPLLAADEPPSGTVRIVSKSIAAGVGVSWGGGTLVYQGAEHKFSLKGLSVIDLGISKIHTSGDVFHLNNLSDFSGHYAVAAEGIAIAHGVNDYILTNDHGVVLRLHGKEKGVRLQAGAEGVSIELKD
jgi:hypothetical protein